MGSVLDRKTKIPLVAEHTSRQKVIQSLLRKVEKVVSTKYIEDLELMYGPPRLFDYSLMSALLMNYVCGFFMNINPHLSGIVICS